ncbi:MAG: hypothetical protein AB8C95_13810 [Phycisphaeraceae bacterium]
MNQHVRAMIQQQRNRIMRDLATSVSIGKQSYRYQNKAVVEG